MEWQTACTHAGDLGKYYSGVQPEGARSALTGLGQPDGRVLGLAADVPSREVCGGLPVERVDNCRRLVAEPVPPGRQGLEVVCQEVPPAAVKPDVLSMVGPVEHSGLSCAGPLEPVDQPLAEVRGQLPEEDLQRALRPLVETALRPHACKVGRARHGHCHREPLKRMTACLHNFEGEASAREVLQAVLAAGLRGWGHAQDRDPVPLWRPHALSWFLVLVLVSFLSSFLS